MLLTAEIELSICGFLFTSFDKIVNMILTLETSLELFVWLVYTRSFEQFGVREKKL